MRVVYLATSLAHTRVLESMKEKDGLEQIVVAPKPQPTSNVIPEDYSCFGIKEIKTYSTHDEAAAIIKKISPNVVAQTNTGNQITIPKNCKRAYISHGMIGNHVIPMSKRGKATTWSGFDLYCGATNIFRDWVEHATGAKQNIVLNAMPQFDLLSDTAYINEYKDRIIKSTKNTNPEKVIIFCGFCCKVRPDFTDHNEDYFSTAIELERISKKHNFLTLIKPRHTFDKTLAFLKSSGAWGKKYVDEYSTIKNSKFIHFVTTNSHIYRYYFADLFVCNGCSTTEIEACSINKPLILVRTKLNSDKYDPFQTVSGGAAVQVRNTTSLEKIIIDSMNKNDHIDKQNVLLEKINLIVDGNAYIRAQEAIKKL